MSVFFFFNDTATTEIYTLSLHDALPISMGPRKMVTGARIVLGILFVAGPLATALHLAPEPALTPHAAAFMNRSEEHTSELQSQSNLVCRLLLEKKKRLQITLRHERIESL